MAEAFELYATSTAARAGSTTAARARAHRRDLCSARFCRIDDPHADLERVYRAPAIDPTRTLWDIYGTLHDLDRPPFVSQVFGAVVIRETELWVSSSSRCGCTRFLTGSRLPTA
jgi:hypothetical protein